MSDAIELTSIEFVEIPATVRTAWVMAQLQEAGGEHTWVELVGDLKQPWVETCSQLAGAVAALFKRPIDDESAVSSMLGLTNTDLRGNFSRATAVSSLRSAVSQLQAARTGQSLAEALGINRSLLDDRSPAAHVIGEQLAEIGVSWFEEPVDPETQTEALARIASATRLPMAGGEGCYGQDSFERLLSAGAVQTIMPDVKHCGGVAEAVRTGRAVANAGGSISLHSPSGPLSLLASAHATAAIDGALALEHAVDEVDWRAELLTPTKQIRQGRLWIPAGPGLGATLDEDAIQRHGRRWKP